LRAKTAGFAHDASGLLAVRAGRAAVVILSKPRQIDEMADALDIERLTTNSGSISLLSCGTASLRKM